MDPAPHFRLFTFTEGLLSRLGHDLQLCIRHFEIELDDGRVHGKFWPDSLDVEGAVRKGRLCASKPDRAARERVRLIASQALQSDRYGEARLEGALHETGDALSMEGSLTLMGQRRALPPAVVHRLGDLVVVQVTLTPSRWGIRPYRAMGGAMRVRDCVKIEVGLPVTEPFDCGRGKARWVVPAPSPGVAVAPVEVCTGSGGSSR